jgi:hypothetical protein
MTYVKPQLMRVGSAQQLIASPQDKNTMSSDNHVVGTPAYDLDE